jgi:alcohol dehydrogenase, propanol-preferring
MRALRLNDWQTPPSLEDVPVPEPGPGQVLVRIEGAGACHSDLHLMEDFEPGALPVDPPFTLGHENAGRVEATGAGVERLDEGTPVAVYGPWGCGRCHRCRRGMENYCERQQEVGAMGGGLGLDGGMAEFLLVPDARLLVPLDGLDPVEAAPLTDAGLTPYHAIKRSLNKLGPGSTTVVIGIGGLGHMAVQILDALCGTQIVAVDTREEALELATEIGAHHTVTAGDQAADEIREISKGLGADLVLDMVGADATLQLAAEVVRAQSDLTVVGIGGGTLEFGFFALPYEASLATTYWGSITELMEVLELARQGRVGAKIRRYSLDDAAQAYEDLKRGDVEGRAVIVPN